MLEQYKERFENITHLTDVKKRDIQLANLMTDLERQYKIPMLSKHDFYLKNKELMKFYLLVSNSRQFEAF